MPFDPSSLPGWPIASYFRLSDRELLVSPGICYLTITITISELDITACKGLDKSDSSGPSSGRLCPSLNESTIKSRRPRLGHWTSNYLRVKLSLVKAATNPARVFFFVSTLLSKVQKGVTTPLPLHPCRDTTPSGIAVLILVADHPLRDDLVSSYNLSFLSLANATLTQMWFDMTCSASHKYVSGSASSAVGSGGTIHAA